MWYYFSPFSVYLSASSIPICAMYHCGSPVFEVLILYEQHMIARLQADILQYIWNLFVCDHFASLWTGDQRLYPYFLG